MLTQVVDSLLGEMRKIYGRAHRMGDPRRASSSEEIPLNPGTSPGMGS